MRPVRREVAPPTGGRNAPAAFCGRPAPGAKLFWHGVGLVRREVAPPTGSECTGCFLWEARPRGEAFLARSWPGSPRGRASHGVRIAPAAFVGGPPSGRSFLARSWPGSPRGRASHRGSELQRLLFVGGPPPGRSFSGTESARFAARSRLPQGSECAGCFCVGGPPSGRCFLTGPAYGPVSIQTVFQGPLAGPTTTNEVNHVLIRASRLRRPRAGGLLP